MLKTGLFILSIISAGALINAVLMALGSFQQRSSLDIGIGLRRVPFYFACGAAGYTAYATLLSINGVMLSLAGFLYFIGGLFCIALLLYGTPLKNLIRLSAFTMDKASLLTLAGFSLIAAFLSLAVLQRMAFVSFDIDLLGHLLSKAKILLYTTYRDSFFFHDQLFANLHTSYPPLFGIFYNLLFLFLGGPSSSYFQAVNYFVLFCLGLSLYAFLKGRVKHWQALAWSFILVSAPNYLKASYIMDNADLMFSLFFLLSIIALYRFFETKQAQHLLGLAFLTAGAALLKNEGLVFAFYTTLVVFLYIWVTSGLKNPKEKLRLFSFFFIPLIVLAGPWWVYQLSLPNAENTLIVGNPAENLSFFFSVARIYLAEIISLKWQGAFVLWALFGLLAGREARRETALLSLLIGLQMATSFLIFYVGQGEALATLAHAASGLRRGIAHVYPAALLLAAFSIGRLSGFGLKRKR